MPRSQVPTVEKLTTDFLKLGHAEQKVVVGVFAAITKVAPNVPTPARSAPLATPAAVRTPVRRAPKPRPTAAAETAALPVDTE